MPGTGGDGRGRLRGAGGERLHHLHVPGPRPCAGQGAHARGAALRALRRQHGLLPRQGGVDARGRHAKGDGAGHRDRGGRRPARRGHGAGVQDAEEPGDRRLFLRRRRRRRGGVSRGGQSRRDLGPAGHLRLRKQPVRRIDPRRSGHAEPPDRRPGRGLWHQGRNRRRQRRPGRLRGGPIGGRRLPAGAGPGLARALDLSPHRPLPPRRLPLSAQGRTRGVVCPRPDRAAGPALDRTRARRAGCRSGDVAPKPRRGFQRRRRAGSAAADAARSTI